jgi:hypothetical protein
VEQVQEIRLEIYSSILLNLTENKKRDQTTI